MKATFKPKFSFDEILADIQYRAPDAILSAIKYALPVSEGYMIVSRYYGGNYEIEKMAISKLDNSGIWSGSIGSEFDNLTDAINALLMVCNKKPFSGLTV